MRIVDDDADDWKKEPKQEDAVDEEDEEPVVAQFIDERPKEVKIMEEFRSSNKWKVIQGEPVLFSQHDSPDPSPPGIGRHDSPDPSPPRRGKRDSPDPSPSRRGRCDSPDPSPPCRGRRDSPDPTPPRRGRRDSPPCRGRRDSPDTSPLRRGRRDSPDPSPPRRGRRDSPDPSPPRRGRRDSPNNKRNYESLKDRHGQKGRYDSPGPSTSQKKRYDSPALSPSRKNRNNRPAETQVPKAACSTAPSSSRHVQERNQNRKKKVESPPLNRKKIAQQNSDSDLSPPRQTRRGGSDSDLSPPHRKKKKGSDADLSPPRNTKRRGSDSDISPPRRRNAGLVSAEVLREEKEEMRQREKDNKHLESEYAETVFRDKSGKRRDLKSEMEAQKEKQAIQDKKDKMYAQWGKGLVQKEKQQQNLEAAAREIQKPLARYIDDEDLDKMLREKEREGDPMAKFLSKKKEKETSGKKERPRYKGPNPPLNRYNIWPGYRWDGVDRSNGFEKQYFARQSEKKAVQETAYKWSVEDM
uniref:BUD13 homolog n=1 Tax=Leptobrachium leishanense TaxID=445787 RepID=A0A8C5WMI4_9ANUR